jgi:hypothetical protein
MMRKSLPFLALLTLAVVPLLAQSDDPPARVARINYLQGQVSFRPGSVEEWTAASLNYPLTTGDHLWADNDARVEVHVGSTAIRMAAHTAMAVLNLDDRTTQLSLTDGSLHLRVRDLQDDEVLEVDTPNAAITILRAGEYRIDADGDSATAAVTVRAGNADVTGGGAAFQVRPRQTGKLIGMDNVQQDIGPALPQNEFDYWCQTRDREEDQATVSEQYVPRDMVGYEDLDRNGQWSDTADYGPVWRPRVSDVDWAPYRYGRWAWVDPWGWTWVDDAPWGFAPFHYGRWVMWNGAWVWAPGRMTPGIRPVYAPALVVFVGTPGFSGAAWFPLGPREVYRPVYHTSDIYLRRINARSVTNITVVNNVYVNQRVRGAITSAPHDTFIGARHIGRDGVRFGEFDRATVIGSAPPVAPQRVSVLGNVRTVPNGPPARIVERQVTVRHTPPPQPVSFEARRPAIEANQGRPLDRRENDRFGQGGEPRFRQAGQGNRPQQPQQQPQVVQPSAPERPIVVPRDERPRPRPVTPAEPQREVQRPQPQPQPRVETPQPPPVERRRVERPEQPAPTPRAERPQTRGEQKQERSEQKSERKGRGRAEPEKKDK